MNGIRIFDLDFSAFTINSTLHNNRINHCESTGFGNAHTKESRSISKHFSIVSKRLNYYHLQIRRTIRDDAHVILVIGTVELVVLWKLCVAGSPEGRFAAKSAIRKPSSSVEANKWMSNNASIASCTHMVFQVKQGVSKVDGEDEPNRSSNKCTT